MWHFWTLNSTLLLRAKMKTSNSFVPILAYSSNPGIFYRYMRSFFSTTVKFRPYHGEVNVLFPRFFFFFFLSPLLPAFLFGGDIKCLRDRGPMYFLAFGKGILSPVSMASYPCSICWTCQWPGHQMSGPGFYQLMVFSPSPVTSRPQTSSWSLFLRIPKTPKIWEH